MRVVNTFIALLEIMVLNAKCRLYSCFFWGRGGQTGWEGTELVLFWNRINYSTAKILRYTVCDKARRFSVIIYVKTENPGSGDSLINEKGQGDNPRHPTWVFYSAYCEFPWTRNFAWSKSLNIRFSTLKKCSIPWRRHFTFLL